LTSQEREAAFCDAVREAGCEPARCYNTHRNRAFDLLAQRWYVDSNVPRWIAALPTPVGIFAAVDYFGVALTQVCREIGLRIPEDVAVLGVDNDDVYCRLARPPLSSVIPSAQRVGYEAGALLDQLLNGHKPPREPVLVEPLGIQTRRSTEVLATDDEDVVAAARFIRESAHQPIKVADVLRVVPVSRRALERRFRRALGRGLAEEISRVRLERGRRLLAETDLSMSRVAEHSGFTDASHLTSVFHRELGITPSEYRRQTRVRNKSS
jgi:LacI family transcriptional regulator